MSASPERHEGTRWQVEIELRYTDLAMLETALADEAEAILTEAIVEAHPLENHPDDIWRLRALTSDEASATALAAQARDVLSDSGQNAVPIRIVALAPRNWAAEVERDAPPIAVGRFLIHGSHHAVERSGRLPLRIDAGLAFGSGRHQTTRGCLRLIEELFNRRRHLDRALDLGTGSGILAVAIARLWRCKVVASDIDLEAVLATRRAACENHVGPLVHAMQGAGLEEVRIRQAAPYDLIVANILAGPLIALAPEIVGALAPDGRLLLSGLLRRQEAEVLAAYRAHGALPVRLLRDGEWTTIGLRHRRRRVDWS